VIGRKGEVPLASHEEGGNGSASTKGGRKVVTSLGNRGESTNEDSMEERKVCRAKGKCDQLLTVTVKESTLGKKGYHKGEGGKVVRSSSSKRKKGTIGEKKRDARCKWVYTVSPGHHRQGGGEHADFEEGSVRRDRTDCRGF